MKFEDEHEELLHQSAHADIASSTGSRHRIKKSRLALCGRVVLVIFACSISAAFGYLLGFYQGRDVLPKLPTDEITRAGYHLQLRPLDDEFDIHLAENELFKGSPRPELDRAWEELIWGLNIRVPHEVAQQTNFSSLQLADGSGDSWATPAVKHNLHCLKAIRQAQFPEHYPENWENMKPGPDGSLSPHFDHCLDNLRQALMCHGDMALYRYGWFEDRYKPWLAMEQSPHICVDWDRLHDWTKRRAFSLYDSGLLVHPKLGSSGPAEWKKDSQLDSKTMNALPKIPNLPRD